MGNSTTSTGPRFSVILPTHDRRELLREAIHSVASQTFADWELIVVDDASRDPIRAEELQVGSATGPGCRRRPACRRRPRW